MENQKRNKIYVSQWENASEALSDYDSYADIDAIFVELAGCIVPDQENTFRCAETRY